MSILTDSSRFTPEWFSQVKKAVEMLREHNLDLAKMTAEIAFS